MAQSAVFAHKSKQVHAIHRQLASDFQPAVKNIASAGQSLLRAYQNFSRNHYVYTASLYALAFSSASAEQEMVQQQHRKQLEHITEVLKTIHAEQDKTVEYFTKMMLTTGRNLEHEKERLKTLQNGFVKRERELAKAVDRGKRQPMELDVFYDQELAEMRDQQAQRYRFFVEKHLELLRHCLEWMHFSTALLEREFHFGGETATGADGTESSGGDGDGAVGEDGDEQGHLDELMEHAERMMMQQQQQGNNEANNDDRNAARIGREESILEPREGPKLRWKNKNAAQKDGILLEEQMQKQKRGSLTNNNNDGNAAGIKQQKDQQQQQQQQWHWQQQQQPHFQMLQQPATVPGLQRPQNQHLLQQQQRQQGLFRPIAILPEQQQKYRHSLIECSSSGITTTAFGVAGGTGGRHPFGLIAGMNGRNNNNNSNLDGLNELHAGQQRQQLLQQYYSEGPPTPTNRDGGGEGRERKMSGEHANDKREHFQQQQVPTRALGQPLQQHQQQLHRQQFVPSAYRTPPYGAFPSAQTVAPPPNTAAATNRYKAPPPPLLAQKPLSPLVTNASNNNNNTFNQQQQQQQHQRGLSQDSTASSGMMTPTRFSRPFTPPLFVPSDYGRLMECTTPYEAQGDNQLSLGVGDQVVLVKSGSRGWVLGRCEDGGTNGSTRQGWFPAKYLKLI